MLNILFSAKPAAWDEYEVPLQAAFAEAAFPLTSSREHAPQDADYIIFAPNGPVRTFDPITKTKAVMGLWAGVETIVDNDTLTQPLCRMVDDGLTAGMVEWVTGHALRHHLGMDTHILGQDGVWRDDSFRLLRPTALSRSLASARWGRPVVRRCTALGFPVTGWSRNPKEYRRYPLPARRRRPARGTDGCADRDPAAAANARHRQHPECRHLALMAKGSFVINPGRGPLIDDDALLAALDSGQIAHATLDVFRIEPLPADHPFWAHPQVTVTPHIASATRPETAAKVIADNIRRGESGLPFRYLG